MKIYKKLIKPMMLVPASANDYSPKKVPIDGEEKWYPEENREALAKKYKHFETTFETLVFEEKYEEVEMPEIIRCENCKHSCDYTDIYTDHAYKCTKNGGYHNDSWFCADGEV